MFFLATKAGLLKYYKEWVELEKPIAPDPSNPVKIKKIVAASKDLALLLATDGRHNLLYRYTRGDEKYQFSPAWELAYKRVADCAICADGTTLVAMQDGSMERARLHDEHRGSLTAEPHEL